MEVYACDEASMRKVLDIDMSKVPGNTNFGDVCASAFKPVDAGWVTLPPMAQMVNDVAVIQVAGPLVAGNAGWRRMFGVIGYEEIKGAVVEAAMRPDVNGILMHFDTPGGAVNGVKPTGDLIKEVGRMKPVVGYAATAASAGYWLASQTSKIFADDLSMIGSIGTIMQFVDLTERNKAEGVQYNIFKSGSLKMAGNPNEPMSDAAKEQFQQVVDDMNAIFYKNVASARRTTPSQLKANFGDGRAVVAARALAGGLIDGLGGQGAAMRNLREQINARFAKAK